MVATVDKSIIRLIKFIVPFFVLVIFIGYQCKEPSGTSQAHVNVRDTLAYLNHSDSAHYVGIDTCKLCHQDIYNSFIKTGMSELKTDLTNHSKLIENTEPRLARWHAIMELIKKSPVIGYGTGSEKKLLKEKYFEKGLYISYLNEFNTHSEYLNILLKRGLVGLFLFLYILYFGFVWALGQRDVLFLSFVIIIAIVSISENILDLNKGIFYLQFSSFLFFCGRKKQRVDFNKRKSNHRYLIAV